MIITQNPSVENLLKEIKNLKEQNSLLSIR